MTPPPDDDHDELPKLPAEPAAEPVAVPKPPKLPRARSEPAAPVMITGDADASAPMTAPEAAALEAARIVSEVVDINTPTGAVIAAHAAAEAAVDIQPADSDEEFDPVQIAAKAINRLRRRAQTDLAELGGQYNRHDILVLMLAFVMIIVAGRVHQILVTPSTVAFDKLGLTFERSTAWLPPEAIPTSPPRIMHDIDPPGPSKDGTYYHVELTSSLEPSARIEVLIEQAPLGGNAVAGLDLERRTRWGELYVMDASSKASIEGIDWLRTAYRFANVGSKGDVPRIERAVEYAAEGKYTTPADPATGKEAETKILHYVVTIYGTPGELERIEEVLAQSLRVAAPTGRQFASQSNPLSRMTYPTTVERAFESTVMVVVADLVDGRLVATGGGSGVIVGGDGSVLTNDHVLHDRSNGRLHDVFVIGRFGERDHAPQLVCAGRPSRSKLQPEVDLALVKCDLDLDGRSWSPQAGPGVWATLPEGHSNDIKVGQHVWVLGYPDVGFGGLTLSPGNVTGWTGVDNTPGRDYFKVSATISNGNSGGPVIDDAGHLIGIASAYRSHVSVDNKMLLIEQKGLARPLSSASDLLAIAAAGWVPREGHTEVELTPSAIEAPAEAGAWLSTRIVDAANEAPIADALVTVLRPGVDFDVNRRDDLVLAWGKSNSAGEVLLKQRVPIPGNYTVMVVARGYEPLIGRDALHLAANTPSAFDPWGKIWLRSR